MADEERQGNGNLNHDRRLREDVFNYGEPSQASPPTIMRQRAKNSSPTKLCLVQLVVPGVLYLNSTQRHSHTYIGISTYG